MTHTKYLGLLILLLSTNLHAFKIEGASIRVNTDFLMNYQHYEDYENGWTSSINPGISGSIGYEFSIKEHHFLIEIESVDLRDDIPIPSPWRAPNPDRELKIKIIEDKFKRYNFLYKYNNRNISLSTGPAMIITEVYDTHKIYESDILIFDDTKNYKETHFGFNTQIDYQLINIKGLSLNINIIPFNYYFGVGNNSSIGLKMAFNR